MRSDMAMIDVEGILHDNAMEDMRKNEDGEPLNLSVLMKDHN
jgi:hypothetical protein